MLFCIAVLRSDNAWAIVSLLSLAFSLSAFALTLGLWVFYLAKQFSTHSIKVMDVKESLRARKPKMAKAAITAEDEDDEERPVRDFADSIVGQMFSRTKEKLNDPLT